MHNVGVELDAGAASAGAVLLDACLRLLSGEFALHFLYFGCVVDVDVSLWLWWRGTGKC